MVNTICQDLVHLGSQVAELPSKYFGTWCILGSGRGSS